MVFFQVDVFIPQDNGLLPTVATFSGTDYRTVAKDAYKAVFMFAKNENYWFDVHYMAKVGNRDKMLKSWYLQKKIA